MLNNPRVVRAVRTLKRRVFLKAIAAGLAAPAAFRLARSATAQSATPPKRFFLFYMPHGVAPEHYDPRVVGDDVTNFTLNETNVSILGGLEPYKQYVNVYQGFQYPGAAATHTGIVNCLSGSMATDTTTPRTTVDQVIAKALGVKALVLGACSHLPFGMDANGMLFWDGTPIDPQKSPVKAADTLFGAAPTDPQPPVDFDVQLRQDLLKLTQGEIDGLKSTLGGLTREQSQLATHLDAVRSVLADASGGPSVSVCTGKPNLPTVEMVRTASAGIVVEPSGGNDYFYQEKNFPILLQAQLEVVTQAIICNAAQVIALMPMYATCDFDFGFAGTPGAHHNGLSHTGPQWAPGAMYNSPITIDNFTAAGRAPFAKAQRWFADQLVNNVVRVLATTDDPAAPGTKVLDNTLIYWMSEIGDGQNHTRLSEVEYPQVPTSLPLVTIGKAGGAMKTGQVVRFPLDVPEKAAMVNRPAADLYLTMARAMGAANVTFPGTTGVLSQVLT